MALSQEFLAKVNDIGAWAIKLQGRSAEVRAQMDALCQEALGKMGDVEAMEAEAEELTDPDQRDKVIACLAELRSSIVAVAGAMRNAPQAVS